MAIETTCENCGKVLRAKDDAAGKKAKCPDCGEIIQIPATGGLGGGGDEFDFSLEDEGPAYDADELPPAPGFGGGDTKPCPACGEMIKSVAKKCRFCGEIFDAKLAKASRATGGSGGIDDDMTTGDWVVAVLCPGIGCIAGIVWAIQSKPKGPKMIGFSLLFGFLWNVLQVIIAAAVEAGR